ncbi:MAG: conjugal transfer protein TraX [Oscillospiraceae bacterium]|nr:conjugal transfer protein TraX [Oscillospiraceae bacterium]
MSAFVIKVIAMTAMLIDHTGLALRPELPEWLYLTMRSIGRIAMPLFCFMIAEGLFHTRNVKKYLARLAVFAFISIVPFSLFDTRGSQLFSFECQNVGFTLFLGLLGVSLFDFFSAKNQKGAALLAIIGVAIIAMLIRSDYDAFGIYYIFIFYCFRKRFGAMSLALTAGFVLAAVLFGAKHGFTFIAFMHLFAPLALIPIILYSGKKGSDSVMFKWLFWSFYPAHLLILAILANR